MNERRQRAGTDAALRHEHEGEQNRPQEKKNVGEEESQIVLNEIIVKTKPAMRISWNKLWIRAARMPGKNELGITSFITPKENFQHAAGPQAPQKACFPPLTPVLCGHASRRHRPPPSPPEPRVGHPAVTVTWSSNTSPFAHKRPPCAPWMLSPRHLWHRTSF